MSSFSALTRGDILESNLFLQDDFRALYHLTAKKKRKNE